MTSTTEAAFRTTLNVKVPVTRAFQVFTDGFDSWWPHQHHIGKTDIAEVLIEGRVGGRWLERGVDGSECEWGRVLAWDPPHRLALSWHLNVNFEYDPDPSRASRVEVRFLPDADGSTRVEFEHTELDRHGDAWPVLLSSISEGSGGWPWLLAKFVTAAQADSD